MLPSAPWEIRDEVELYAREHGRHGTIGFIPGLGWEVRLTLKADDERMALYQLGLVPEVPVESVLLVEPNPDAGQVKNGRREGPYRPLDIHQMGASGVRTFLERGNTWSGRGEHSSVTEAVRKAKDQDAENTVRFREQMKEENRYERREKRRQYQQIPAVTVGVDLKPDRETT